jgi:acyl carrier protein
MHESLDKEIIEIIAINANKKPDDINHEANITDLGLDSLTWLDVLAEMEEKLDVLIPDEQLSEITNIKQLIDIIEKQSLVKT